MSMTPRCRRRAPRGAAVAVVAALALSGCGASHDKTTPRPPTEPRPVTTRTTIAHVTGPLKPKARTAIVTQVGKVVDGWFDAAYVGGDYPRQPSAFTTAFPGFTAGAAAEARTQLRLMSNADLGPRIDGVRPLAKAVKLDVLAAKGWPVGVTARVWLNYRTSGMVTRQLVRGQLDLVKVEGAWKVFAFTISKTRRPLAAATAGPGSPSTAPSRRPSGGASS
ncbi:hypothetical protein AB3X52_18590 [Nocardioides sp. DS6]|uniref:Nuclear transport factor 2 family protein n=1 Tax=Nocardioides eburneus TaxID=3231482 RepID=A0ABV3T347_9ACTN